MSTISALIADMAQTANELLAALPDDQRRAATRAFSDETERRTWYYTPTPREGLPLVYMQDPKHTNKVMKLLALGMSEAGYNYVAGILGSENIVSRGSNFPERPYGGLEGTRMRDPLNYFVTFFGDPSSDTWGWRVGGHHLSVAFTINKGALSPTPAFFGAEPARITMPGGVQVRLLAAEEDLARELLLLLSPEQREQAVISPIAPTDIVQMNRPKIQDGAIPPPDATGPGGVRRREELGITPEHDEMVRYTTKPKGLRAGDMHGGQRAVLQRLIHTYFEHLADPIVEQYEHLLSAPAFDATHFAWAGPANVGDPHYYRVQGERLLIEYDCVQSAANHTHSVWRDPQGDFGDDILAEHYAASHR